MRPHDGGGNITGDGLNNTLPREFYLRDARDVARDLLGKELVRESSDGRTSGLIVETEAYLGASDRASHAFGHRTTRRTSIMYEEGGRAYIYFIYGMYWCLNITAREKEVPEAVLIRGLEPVTGVELMRRRRGAAAGKRLPTLTNGPGKLCLAMAVDGTLYGEDLCGRTLFVLDRPRVAPEEIVASPRVNIDYAKEAVAHEWRYYLRNNHFVSRP